MAATTYTNPAANRIVIRLRDQFGTEVAHPVCDNAKRFAAIAGSKTLTASTLKLVRELGYEVEVETGHVRAVLRAA